MKEISILLGKEGNKDKYWEPSKERSPHLVLIGGSGSGKTETLKSICFELKKQTVPSLIIDFHDDFSVFAENLISLENTTIHPLEVQIDEKPIDVCYRIAKIFAKIFDFGEIQEAILREAIKKFYFKSGVDNIKIALEKPIDLLEFSEFKSILKKEFPQDKSLSSIIAKMGCVFDTDLFMNAKSTALPFDAMLNKISVLKLNDFPNDEIKATIAEIILRNLINKFYLKGKSNEGIKLFCIIDEAHRVTYDGSPVDLLLRESRKYGIGVILASQQSTDFSDTIMSNVGTIISFQCSLAKDARHLSNTIGIAPNLLQKLSGPGNCYLKLASEVEPQKIYILPSYKRPGLKETIDKFDEQKSKETAEKELKVIHDQQKKLSEYSTLKKEYPKLESLLTETQEKLNQKSKEYKKTKEELERLDAELSKSTASENELTSKINLLQGRIQKINKNNEEEKIELMELHKKELDSLAINNQDKEFRLNQQHKKEIDNLQLKIDKNIQKYEEAFDELSKQHNTKIINLEENLRTLNEDLKNEKKVSKEAFKEIERLSNILENIKEKTEKNFILKGALKEFLE